MIFASFFSGRFTTMTVVNPLEMKLAKKTYCVVVGTLRKINGDLLGIVVGT